MFNRKKTKIEKDNSNKIDINKSDIKNIAEHSKNYNSFLLEMKEFLLYKKIIKDGTVYYGDKEYKKMEKMIFETMCDIFEVPGIEQEIIKDNFDKFLYRSKNEEQMKKALEKYKELENIMEDIDELERKAFEKEEEIWRVWDNS